MQLLINGGAVVGSEGEEREAMEEALLEMGNWWLFESPFDSEEVRERKLCEKELRLRRLLYPQSHDEVQGVNQTN